MDSTDLSQYKIKEWRLERMLGVSHFRLPPDFRTKGNDDNDMNRFLTVPFLRFPKWHYCSFCGQMQELEYHQKNKELCKGCEQKGYKNFIFQVPFVAMCEKGHLQDFLGGSGSIKKKYILQKNNVSDEHRRRSTYIHASKM